MNKYLWLVSVLEGITTHGARGAVLDPFVKALSVENMIA